MVFGTEKRKFLPQRAKIGCLTQNVSEGNEEKRGGKRTGLIESEAAGGLGPIDSIVRQTASIAGALGRVSKERKGGEGGIEKGSAQSFGFQVETGLARLFFSQREQGRRADEGKKVPAEKLKGVARHHLPDTQSVETAYSTPLRRTLKSRGANCGKEKEPGLRGRGGGAPAPRGDETLAIPMSMKLCVGTRPKKRLTKRRVLVWMSGRA